MDFKLIRFLDLVYDNNTMIIRLNIKINII